MSEDLFLQPKEVSKVLSSAGQKKAETSFYELFTSGILAGMYIAFGAMVATVILSGGTLDTGLARFLSGSVFSVGLMLVLIPGAELFTGNILMTVGLLDKRLSLIKMFRNWAIVYCANFTGAVFLAWLVYNSGLLGAVGALTPVGAVAVNITGAKLSLGFIPALFRGILCNMLVCLAVIMCITSRTIIGKIFGIYFPIMVFVASGYEHSIANMYFLPAGLFAGGEFIARFLLMFKNLIPVTIGNIIGGLIVVLFYPKSGKKLLKLFSSK